MNEYQVPQFLECPRCGFRSYESFSTHSYCANCNYSPSLAAEEYESAIPDWAIEAMNEMSQPREKEKLPSNVHPIKRAS